MSIRRICHRFRIAYEGAGIYCVNLEDAGTPKVLTQITSKLIASWSLTFLLKRKAFITQVQSMCDRVERRELKLTSNQIETN